MANEKRHDLIDRQAFIEDIKAEIMNLYLDGMKGTPRPRSELYDIIDRINEQPSVDAVEVVHAHWEDGCAIHNGKEVYKSIDCSHCNEIFKIESHDREYWKARFRACPFCGAVMDGGNEDG